MLPSSYELVRLSSDRESRWHDLWPVRRRARPKPHTHINLCASPHMTAGRRAFNTFHKDNIQQQQHSRMTPHVLLCYYYVERRWRKSNVNMPYRVLGPPTEKKKTRNLIATYCRLMSILFGMVGNSVRIVAYSTNQWIWLLPRKLLWFSYKTYYTK